jgi:hypothetical protein
MRTWQMYCSANKCTNGADCVKRSASALCRVMSLIRPSAHCDICWSWRHDVGKDATELCFCCDMRDIVTGAYL